MQSSNGLSDKELNIITRILKPYAAKISQVKIFGSRATGKYRKNSDIDLVIYGSFRPRLPKKNPHAI